MPQDAPVITSYCSDYEEIDSDWVSIMEPNEKGGIIDHHGHLMYCHRKWLGDPNASAVFRLPFPRHEEKHSIPTEETVNFLTCVYFKGN
jgi:predicted dehydrogenase